MDSEFPEGEGILLCTFLCDGGGGDARGSTDENKFSFEWDKRVFI